LRDKCPILALDPLAAFDGLNGDGIGIDAKANPAKLLEAQSRGTFMNLYSRS
jgi:hypothetical protein